MHINNMLIADNVLDTEEDNKVCVDFKKVMV